MEKVNLEELDKFARYELKEIIHGIANIMIGSLAEEDKAYQVSDILERLDIIKQE